MFFFDIFNFFSYHVFYFLFKNLFFKYKIKALLVKLVDTSVLGTGCVSSVGSSPTKSKTYQFINTFKIYQNS